MEERRFVAEYVVRVYALVPDDGQEATEDAEDRAQEEIDNLLNADHAGAYDPDVLLSVEVIDYRESLRLAGPDD